MSDESENVLWFLCDLASMDKLDIDSDDFDVCFEGEDGRDHRTSISITKLAQAAYDKIDELHEENADKFNQIETLKKQVNDLQMEINRSASVIIGDGIKRERWVYTGTDAMFCDPDSVSLEETQEAAKRLLERE